MSSRLLVTADRQPETHVNITQVLSTTDRLSGPTTLTIAPSKSFNVSFPADLFKSNGESLTYYATLSDHTPMPAWISFDASSLHFAGSTPPTAVPQTLDILLIACGTPGYAASSVAFTLAVFRTIQTLNMSKDGGVHITGLKRILALDDAPIRDQDFQSITGKLSSWLSMDNQSFDISGTAPTGTKSQDLVMTAKDQYGDVAQLNIHLASISELFAAEIGRLNATVGEHFEYHVPQGVLLNSNEDVSVDLSTLSDHLRFDSATLTISGSMPDGFAPQDVQCTLTASSSDGVVKDTQTFQISITTAVHGATAINQLHYPRHERKKCREAKSGHFHWHSYWGRCWSSAPRYPCRLSASQETNQKLC